MLFISNSGQVCCYKIQVESIMDQIRASKAEFGVDVEEVTCHPNYLFRVLIFTRVEALLFFALCREYISVYLNLYQQLFFLFFSILTCPTDSQQMFGSELRDSAYHQSAPEQPGSDSPGRSTAEQSTATPAVWLVNLLRLLLRNSFLSLTVLMFVRNSFSVWQFWSCVFLFVSYCLFTCSSEWGSSVHETTSPSD